MKRIALAVGTALAALGVGVMLVFAIIAVRVLWKLTG